MINVIKFNDPYYQASGISIYEKKDHLIRRVPNLTPEQMQLAIDHFNRFPHKETEIDWNRLNTLTWDDFKKVIDKESNTQRKKVLKKQGIKGLISGKDYYDISASDSILAYVPLTYEASKLIASKYVGGVEGKWCTAYQKTDEHWREYTLRQGLLFIYMVVATVTGVKKYAVAIEAIESDLTSYTSLIFDQEDRSLNNKKAFEEEIGITLDAILKEHKPTLIKALSKLAEQKHILEEIIQRYREKALTDKDYQGISETFINILAEVNGYTKIRSQALKRDGYVVVPIGSEFFNRDDREVLDNYIFGERDYSPAPRGTFSDYMSSESLFYEATYYLNGKSIEIINNKIKKELTSQGYGDWVKDFSFDNYSSLGELLEDFSDNDIDEDIFFDMDIMNTIRMAFDSAYEISIYQDVVRGYKGAIDEVGGILLEPYIDGDVKFPLDAIMDIFIRNLEYIIDEDYAIEEFTDMSLTVDVTSRYYQPDINQEKFNDVFQDYI